MNKYLQKLIYGQEHNRSLIHEALGVPDTAVVLDAEVTHKPHIAIVDGVITIWNVGLQEWVAYALVPLEILTLETVTDTSYLLEDGNMIDMIVMRSANSDSILLGETIGGSEISLIPIELIGGEWKSVNVQIIANGGDKTIYFTGFTGAALIKIYKRKLLP